MNQHEAQLWLVAFRYKTPPSLSDMMDATVDSTWDSKQEDLFVMCFMSRQMRKNRAQGRGSGVGESISHCQNDVKLLMPSLSGRMLCPGVFISLNVDALAMVHFISTSQHEQVYWFHYIFLPTQKIPNVKLHFSLKTWNKPNLTIRTVVEKYMAQSLHIGGFIFGPFTNLPKLVSDLCHLSWPSANLQSCWDPKPFRIHHFWSYHINAVIPWPFWRPSIDTYLYEIYYIIKNYEIYLGDSLTNLKLFAFKLSFLELIFPSKPTLKACGR